MSPDFVLLFELRPQPADAFRARLWHPAEASTEKCVFLFAFQRKAAGFRVERGQLRVR